MFFWFSIFSLGNVFFQYCFRFRSFFGFVFFWCWCFLVPMIFWFQCFLVPMFLLDSDEMHVPHIYIYFVYIQMYLNMHIYIYMHVHTFWLYPCHVYRRRSFFRNKVWIVFIGVCMISSQCLYSFEIFEGNPFEAGTISFKPLWFKVYTDKNECSNWKKPLRSEESKFSPK